MTEPPSPALAPPPGQPRFALFDGIRGIAVVAVLTFHVAIPTAGLDGSLSGDLIQVAGHLAVPVFFAVSAFLLYRPFAAARAAGRPRPDVRRYLRRRALRVVPGYWVALTLLAIFPGVVGVVSGDWWRHYAFLQIYELRTFATGIPQAWTLCVEVVFYLLLPAWAIAIDRVGTRFGRRVELAALAAIAAAGMVVQVLAAQLTVPYVVGQTLAGQAPAFTAGMALAIWSVRAQQEGPDRVAATVVRFPGACWMLALAAYAGLVALLPDGGLFAEVALRTQVLTTESQAGGRAVLAVLFSVALLLPAVFGEDAGGWPRRVLALRPIAYLGVVSYGIYLYHLTLSELLATDRDPDHYRADAGLGLADALPLPTLTLTLLTLALSVVLATISYRLVELPFLRLKERRRG